MANKRTGLITGANAKIQIGGTTMAYASNVQYALDIQTIPVEVMDKLEVVDNVPVAYFVNGSFDIVRYTKACKDANGAVSTATNSPDAWKVGGLQAGADKKISEHFNPGKYIEAQTVDIVLYQRYWDGSAETSKMFLKIVDCKLTRRSATINKRSVMIESFAFVGEMMSDDVITASASGEVDLSV